MCTTAFEVKLAFKPNLPFLLSNSRARIPTWTFFPQWLHRSEMLLVNDEFSGVISAFSHSGRTLCGSIFFQAGTGRGGGSITPNCGCKNLKRHFKLELLLDEETQNDWILSAQYCLLSLLQIVCITLCRLLRATDISFVRYEKRRTKGKNSKNERSGVMRKTCSFRRGRSAFLLLSLLVYCCRHVVAAVVMVCFRLFFSFFFVLFYVVFSIYIYLYARR